MRKASKLLGSTVALGLVFGATSLSAHAATEKIESGETLWEIAKKHENVSVEDIMSLNEGLNPNAIPIGTEITLPSGENSSENTSDHNMTTHTIQAGDTLYSIAHMYDGVNVDDLYKLNDELDPYHLMIGSDIVVKSSETSDDSTQQYVYHTVQPGNTFYEIANVYDGVSIDELIKANPDVDMHSLQVGTEIAVPLK